MREEHLPGGNTHTAVVRLNETVRRPTGPWTPAVHDLLRHLERKGFEGSPRVLGIDDQGREILTFIPGDVVYPDHFELVMTDAALGAIARLIRNYHDAVADFDHVESHQWSDRGSDAHPGGELVCHNDLAPWNLVHAPGGRWTFIDWDLAAPGSREWDLAWAILTFIPLMPGHEMKASVASHRLSVFREAYGVNLSPDVIDSAVERCAREADLIQTLGEKGEEPFVRLLAEGHHEIWATAKDHVERQAEHWKNSAFGIPGRN